MKLTLRWLAAVLSLGPALYVLGHLYLYSAPLAGYWFGPWSDRPSTIMAVGITGVATVVLAVVSLAPIVCITAFDWRSSRSLAESNRLRFLESVALGLGQTRWWPTARDARDNGERSVRNRAEWAAVLFGGPAIASNVALIVFDRPLASAVIIGTMIGLFALLMMSVRLRKGAFPAPWHDVVFLGIAQFHAAVLACYFYISADFWLFPLLAVETRNGLIFILGLSVLCAALVAWLLFPASRAAAQRRVAMIGILVLGLSLFPGQSGRIITTSMTYTVGAQARGQLVATAGSFVVPKACPPLGCTSLDDVRLIADLGDVLVFWYTAPTPDGYRTLHRATLPTQQAHFDLREHHAIALNDWALFR